MHRRHSSHQPTSTDESGNRSRKYFPCELLCFSFFNIKFFIVDFPPSFKLEVDCNLRRIVLHEANNLSNQILHSLWESSEWKLMFGNLKSGECKFLSLQVSCCDDVDIYLPLYSSLYEISERISLIFQDLLMYHLLAAIYVCAICWLDEIESDSTSTSTRFFIRLSNIDINYLYQKFPAYKLFEKSEWESKLHNIFEVVLEFVNGCRNNVRSLLTVCSF